MFTRRRLAPLLTSVLWLGSGVATFAADTPRRVVSINLCVDQLALLLATEGQLVSVSWLSRDLEESALWLAARDLHLNYGSAEEILPLEPDLVLAGAYTTRYTVSLLTRLGYRVLEIESALTLDDIRGNIRLVAAALGREQSGERLVTEFDRDLNRLRDRKGPGPQSVVVYRPGGYTVGAGGLTHEVLSTLGLRNIAAEIGLNHWGSLNLEQLLRADPDWIVLSTYRAQAPSQANTILEHGVFERLRASGRVIEVPSKLWSCGTPAVVLGGHWLRDQMERGS